MSEKHTPGPWAVDHDEVACFDGPLVRRFCAPEADMRLIAAAPDLLAFCETLIAGLNSGVVAPLPGGFVEALNAAFFKATGRTT